ncbi:hypothetical protein EJ05DRAFT_504277 [Pseudovirgaria hyperparasitica]|uniref:Amine oxidase domain-containing protein n=1 Tax=Pseudovirgaria hyperparasitica TaxID=470096 RepID=A0A6A6VVI1_9PEZI|nr:uncharacterized protein EJ05DRAFT_504277 [Pseudovirgaria hyperparasitica]KAF2754175.1 hypothetical protein EJ05DRAFT_504277 [Pseudovirgaria hyperparasitica]
MFLRSVFVVAASLCQLGTAGPVANQRLSFMGPFNVEAGGVHNIHVEYHRPIDGELSIHYGVCRRASKESFHHKVGRTHVGSHPLAKRHLDWSDRRPTRFVWLPPSDIDRGCLQAWIEDELVGESEEFMVKRRVNRRGLFADSTDAVGAWFDGVEYLSQKEPDEVFVSSVKTKRFGIVGGGMAGLTTALLLDSVGIHNWQIIESTGRIGGRVHTFYAPGTTGDDYQYQEMGPMRFPVEITDSDTNETIQIMDHRLVFQLADYLNNMNNNDSALAVNFIPFIMSGQQNLPSSTTQRRPDGTVPTVGEVSANPSLAVNASAQYLDPSAVEAAQAAYDAWVHYDDATIKSIASNVFKAHRAAVDSGFLDFSEAGYLRYALEANRNTSDLLDSLSATDPSWLYENVYFSATSWRTIDKGMNRLPLAFWPLIHNRTLLNTKVSRITFHPQSQSLTLHSLPPNASASTPYTSHPVDYLTIAVPFPITRSWRFSPPHSSLLTRAMSSLNYAYACKLALLYKSRFWEHSPSPIYGGCVTTSIPSLGSTCYPSYALNSSRPGMLLASYISGTTAPLALGGLAHAAHAAIAQRAIEEIHGPVAAAEYTGVYERVCWANEADEGASWASPGVGQHPLYIPAFHQTEQRTVFVGEHTSVTHAWIFSAVESAVRGVVQVLLDAGLVDEAKGVSGRWMARWISV